MTAPSRVRTLVLVATASLALTACAPDPIIGTWRNTVSVLGSDFISDFVFHDTNAFETVTTSTYPGDSTSYPGCVQVTRSSGGSWSTSRSGSDMVLALAPAPAPSVTIERHGCQMSADNIPATQQDPSTAGMTANGTYTYSISGTQLSLTSTGNGMTSTTVFTRVP